MRRVSCCAVNKSLSVMLLLLSTAMLGMTAHASYQSLSQMLRPIVVILAVFSVTLSVVLTTVFVVLISHQVAGPMFRFVTVLESLAQRSFEAYRRIRPADQLGELALSLDKALEVVKTDIQALQQSVEVLKTCHAKGDQAALLAEIQTMDGVLHKWKKQ